MFRMFRIPGNLVVITVLSPKEYGPCLGIRGANLLLCGWLCEIPVTVEPWGVKGAGYPYYKSQEPVEATN